MSITRVIKIGYSPSQERLLQSLAASNYRLNRHAIDGLQNTFKVVQMLGGLEQIERISNLEKIFSQLEQQERFEKTLGLCEQLLLQRHECRWLWGGFRDFLEIINSEDLNNPDTNRAIKRLARHFGIRLKNPRAMRGLKSLEGQRYAKLLRQRYFPDAIRATLTQMDRPQRMRIERRGKGWLKTRKGAVAQKRPDELDLFYLILWFRKEVYKNLSDLLSYNDALNDTVDWLNIEDFGSEDLIVQEDLSLSSRLDVVPFTLRERELLELSECFTRPTQVVAEKLGISISTVRVLKHRIIKKSRLLLSR